MKKLLIIEDNHMMMTFLANYFADAYQIESANKPSEAMTILTREPQDFDVILSDYKSSNHEEYKSLKSIAAMSKWNNVPMIILTDEDKSLERLEALNIGARDTLSKPFNPKELSMRVSSLLNQVKLSKALIRKAA